MIFVVNKKNHIPTPSDFYIGRGSPLGNPYIFQKSKFGPPNCSSREEAIELYKKYLVDKIEKHDRIICEELNRIYNAEKNGDVYLVCFCYPLACHGAIISDIIQKKINENRIKQSDGNVT